VSNSKYEKYVTRGPLVITGMKDGQPVFEQFKGEVLPPSGKVTSGPRMIFSNDIVKEGTSKIEYGWIMADGVLLRDGGNYGAHKHDYPEIFVFFGNNPNDSLFLGAEGEFWLGEGADTEKIKFDKACSFYVPAGVAHFPLFMRNVTSPVQMVVVVPVVGDFELFSVER
jgi:uncharacterized RmlC-like cupin family protein